MSEVSKLAYGFVSLAVVSAGCDRYDDTGLALARAEGTVTYNGVPLEGATVTMQNSIGLATGTTDAQGRFAMATVHGGISYPGVPQGALQVTVTKTEAIESFDVSPPPANDAPAEEIKANEEIVPKAEANRRKATAPRSLIPANYADPKTSGLMIKLTRKGKTDIQIVLTDD